MDHAITLGNVLWVVGGFAVAIGVAGILFGILYLLNPFRTGH